MTHGKTYNKSPRRINHKASKSKTNTGTTALERSVEQTTGGFKASGQVNTRGGLGGLVVSALDFQAGYRGFESRSGRDNFQIISTPSSYSTCPGLSIKWTGRRLVTDSGTKCAWVIHESKAVQIHVHHSNRRCLYVPRVPGSVKNPHNNNNNNTRGVLLYSLVCNVAVCLRL